MGQTAGRTPVVLLTPCASTLPTMTEKPVPGRLTTCHGQAQTRFVGSMSPTHWTNGAKAEAAVGVTCEGSQSMRLYCTETGLKSSAMRAEDTRCADAAASDNPFCG